MDGITSPSLPKVDSQRTVTRLKTEPVNRVKKLQQEESQHNHDGAEQSHHEKNNNPPSDGCHLQDNPDAVSHVNRLLRQKGMQSSSNVDELRRYRFKRNRQTGSIDLFDETLQDAILSLSMEEMSTLARFLDESSGVMSDCAG
jgi:hypothetical protein